MIAEQQNPPPFALTAPASMHPWTWLLPPSGKSELDVVLVHASARANSGET